MIIPGPQVNHTEQTTNLDGTTYIIRFDWNGRIQRWFMSFFASDGTALAEGICIVTGVDLLRPYRADARMPQRSLFVGYNGTFRDPLLDDFKPEGRAWLYYG